MASNSTKSKNTIWAFSTVFLLPAKHLATTASQTSFPNNLPWNSNLNSNSNKKMQFHMSYEALTETPDTCLTPDNPSIKSVGATVNRNTNNNNKLSCIKFLSPPGISICNSQVSNQRIKCLLLHMNIWIRHNLFKRMTYQI